jgi:hypoxanthine phosphoribosyltransferase
MILDLKKGPLISRDEILSKVRDLGKRITTEYSDREPVIVGILNGAVFFFTDLVREIGVPMKMDFIRASSYGSGSTSSGVIRFTKDLELSIKGQPLIIVEDIVDTGLTLAKIVKTLKSRGPESIRTCVLIDKRERREIDIAIDYSGFRVEKGFLVGYGLDYDEKYRYLPEIYSLD